MRFLLAGILLFLVGCSSSNEKADVSYQEGNQYTVVCRNEVQECYEKCLNLCPKGYLVKNRVRGHKTGDETEYTVMIRCKK